MTASRTVSGWLSVVISVLVIVATACGGDDEPRAVDPTSAPTAIPSPTPPSDPAAVDALTRTLSKLNTITSYRATISSPGPDGTKIDGFVEFAAPDRAHVSIGANEFITIGNATYARSGDEWIGPIDSQAGIGTLLTQNLNDSINLLRAQGINLGGEDVVEGRPCSVYKAGTTEFCIGADDLPVRIIDRIDENNATVVLFTEYNTPVTIEPPANARPQ